MEINKRYVYGYSIYLLLGEISFSYIGFLYFEENNDLKKTYPFSIYFAGVSIGNLLNGIFVRTSKRKKLIIANIMIIVFSIPAFIFRGKNSLFYCFDFIESIGIGIMAPLIIIYMDEIFPSSMKSYGLLLIPIGFIVGAILENILTGLQQYYFTNFGMDLVSELTPIFISLLQLLLTLFKYKYNSPKYLYENSESELCAEELMKIYIDEEQRLIECNLMEYNKNEKICQYPTYAELFSKKYIKSLFIGAVLIFVRNFIILFPFLDHIWLGSEKIMDLYFTSFLYLFILLGAILSFFIVTEFGKKKILFIGSILMFIAYTSIAIMVIFFSISTKYYIIIIMSLSFVIFGISGASIYSLSLVYTIQILPERGFTLVIIFHWISLLLYHFANDDYTDKIYITIYIIYNIGFMIITIGMAIFAKIGIKNIKKDGLIYKDKTVELSQKISN